MKIKSIIIFSLKLIINVLINYLSILFNDRDFLFKFEFLISYNLDFDFDSDIFAYIVNFIIFFVQVESAIEAFMILFRNVKLNIIIKYVVNECYQIFYKLTKLIIYE